MLSSLRTVLNAYTVTFLKTLSSNQDTMYVFSIIIEVLQQQKLKGGKKKIMEQTKDAVDMLKKGMESKKGNKSTSVAYQV